MGIMGGMGIVGILGDVGFMGAVGFMGIMGIVGAVYADSMLMIPQMVMATPRPNKKPRKRPMALSRSRGCGSNGSKV